MYSTPKPNPSSGSGDGGGSSSEEGAKDTAVAKTAGFVVFSGIAMSIIKAFNLKPHQQPSQPTPPPISPPAPPPSPPVHDSSQKHSLGCEGLLGSTTSSARTIEIVRGDTLWGFSRKYGVSIDAIKEANGLTGDTIYAGKKLIIPSK